MTDQSRSERESPRTMTPELLAARITLRVAELRLLAAVDPFELALYRKRRSIPSR